MNQDQRAASDVLRGVVEQNKSDYISLYEIKLALHERGFGLLMIIFAIPLSVPLLPPGLTAVPAIPLLFFSVQMLMGRDSPWMPKWLSRKTMKRSTLAFIVEKTAPYLSKIEKLLRQRIPFASSATGEKIIGAFCIVFSISILIPLPFTNLIPAIAIVITSLGLLSKDGVTVIVGIIVGCIGVTITALILFLGQKAVMSLFSSVV